MLLCIRSSETIELNCLLKYTRTYALNFVNRLKKRRFIFRRVFFLFTNSSKYISELRGSSFKVKLPGQGHICCIALFLFTFSIIKNYFAKAHEK